MTATRHTCLTRLHLATTMATKNLLLWLSGLWRINDILQEDRLLVRDAEFIGIVMEMNHNKSVTVCRGGFPRGLHDGGRVKRCRLWVDTVDGISFFQVLNLSSENDLIFGQLED